ncbi:MAG TPA: glycosyltransferase family 39 protein [Candidatus Hydrogenedentes bacterium]|nr:glycosyltransferase family 39 protein [Candidatus Hydrogenedentota bacterium]
MTEAPETDAAPVAPPQAGGLERCFVRRPLLFVLVLAGLSTLLFQGSRGLYESTEGRYAECARQSAAAGSLWEPVLNGKPHWTKPPATYLATAAGLALLGENAWGARIGLSVAFVLTVLVVFRMGTLVWDRRAGAWCALVYAASPFTAGASNALSTDTYLALWMAATALFFWYSVRGKRLWSAVALGAALGAGFMTKGPVALLALIAVAVAYAHLRRRGDAFPAWHLLAGALVFAALGLPWFIVKMAQHPELRDYWILHETIGRNLYGEFDRNPEFYKPLTVYGPVLLFGALPWTALILFRRRGIPWPSGQWLRVARWPHAAEWLFIVSGLLGPLAVFSLSTSRLALYLLPLFVPISLALGKGLDHLVEGGALGRRGPLRLAVAVALALVVAKGIAARVESPHDMRQLAEKLAPALGEFPERDLLVLGEGELYGLQFYTGERMRALRVEEAQDAVKESRNTGRAQLVLVKTKLLEKLAPHMDTRVYETRQVADRWALIIFKAPEAKNGGA